jgi:hydrogenase-4 component B
MKKQEDGSRAYVNRWWKYLDLEDYFYRPVLLKILPAIAGTVCLMMDRLVDGVVVLLRKTIYKDSPRQTELDEGNELTHGIGVLLNKLQEWLNFTIFRSKPKNTDYEHRMAMSFSSLKENMGFIGRSLSYGLILFCLGLCVVLIYLLVSSLL